MKPILYLRLSISSGPSQGSLPSSTPNRNQAMPKTIYLGWVPGCCPWASGWPLPMLGHLMPLYRLHVRQWGVHTFPRPHQEKCQHPASLKKEPLPLDREGATREGCPQAVTLS